jgi:hypothetical protein
MAEDHAGTAENASGQTPATLDDALDDIRAAMDKVFANESLLLGARAGDFARVQAAVANGADKAQADEHGNTAMHLAALSGNRPLVAYLIGQKFAPDLTNKAGFTPLASAISGGHAEIADDLTLAGANVNHAIPGLKETLLMVAAYRDLPALVAGLIKHGAVVDARDNNGVTAAMRAAAQDSAVCLALLMDGGADPYLKSNSGRTAYDFARRSRAAGAIGYLSEYMPEYLARVAEQGQKSEIKTLKKISFKAPDYIPVG